MKILRFLRGHIRAFALVMVLLVAQAMAELSLPQYMSDIVDVGVEQGGISSGVAMSVRAETLADVELLMDEGSVALVESCYSAPNSSGVRSFVGNPEQQKHGSELAEAMERAEVAYLTLASAPSSHGLPTLDELREGVLAGSVTRADLVDLAEEVVGEVLVLVLL